MRYWDIYTAPRGRSLEIEFNASDRNSRRAYSCVTLSSHIDRQHNEGGERGSRDPTPSPLARDPAQYLADRGTFGLGNMSRDLLLVHGCAVANGPWYTLVCSHRSVKAGRQFYVYTNPGRRQALPIHGGRERSRRHILLRRPDPRCTRSTASWHSYRWQLHPLCALVDGVDRDLVAVVRGVWQCQ